MTVEIKLPEKYDRDEIETLLNQVLGQLENNADDANLVKQITSADRIPQNVREKQLFLNVPDGDTRELIIRDQGKNWKLIFTEVT